MPLTLGEIAAILKLPRPRRAEHKITGLANLADAGPDQLSYLASDKYLGQFDKTRAAGVIVQKRVKLPSPQGSSDDAKAVFIVDDADLAVAKILEHFAPPIPRPPIGKHHSAFIAPSAALGDGCRIGPNVVIGDDCRIGRNCTIHAGVIIVADVALGDDCELFPGVVIRERITIGSRVIIHAGSVLGTDGFGYRWDGTKHAKIPQIGTVIIEDDVEIGSCVCIDRAKFSATTIGRGTKIDNLAQVGHNVSIGPHCIITGQVGLAGSVTLGAGVVMGGQSAARDHVSVGDGAMVAGCSGVAEDVEAKTIVSGLPALPHRQTLREQAALRRLPEMVVQIRKLQEEIEQLKKSAGGGGAGAGR